MPELLGDCRWCRRPISWDHYAGGWRHTETHSLLCPDGVPAEIDIDPDEGTGNRITAGASR
jgi:hypothetical protein